jgi:hypothetical protein
MAEETYQQSGYEDQRTGWTGWIAFAGRSATPARTSKSL